MCLFFPIAASRYVSVGVFFDVQSITQKKRETTNKNLDKEVLPILYSNPFILNVFPRISIFSLVRQKRSLLVDVAKASVEY